MDALTAVLLVALALLAAALVVVLVRSGAGVPQQLAELRARLDGLVAAQGEVPRALAEGSAEQARSLAEVRERLVRLSEATARLEAVGQSVAQVQELLKVPKLRGTLGEVWLEELLRQVFPAGLFETQYGFSTGERVDAVIRVGDRLVPVDAKFPLEACQRVFAADGEAAERERRAFRRSLRARVDEIADKYIRPEEGTFDFALMYIPAENVYYEAVVRGEEPTDEESLVGYALERRVIPVSPNSFYAYLAAILHGLRGLEVEQRAQEILAGLGGLQQKLARFQRTHALVGRHLENALRQYGESGRELQQVQGMLERLTGVGGTVHVDDRDMTAVPPRD
ncbi:MAG: DNA recombination protein RmuC [Gemmatimonadota bacterium]|nr:MAG: DNA recombination protein RmuC [Gemmatimonadota bacterium]